jgi:hypothetical protein
MGQHWVRGIGTLMQGGSIKDALKSAAISGLSGAAYSKDLPDLERLVKM